MYEQRPLVCRDFDNTSCEVNAPGRGHTYTEPAQFLDWLRTSKPGLYQRVARKYMPPQLGVRARKRAP